MSKAFGMHDRVLSGAGRESTMCPSLESEMPEVLDEV